MVRRERVPPGHASSSLRVVDQSHTIPVLLRPDPGHSSRIHTERHRHWPDAILNTGVLQQGTLEGDRLNLLASWLLMSRLERICERLGLSEAPLAAVAGNVHVRQLCEHPGN